jgi:hypothetical protein
MSLVIFAFSFVFAGAALGLDNACLQIGTMGWLFHQSNSISGTNVPTKPPITHCFLGHSLGSKVAYHLLNFAKEQKREACTDTHIYSDMPISGTHIGFPMAMTTWVGADKSCLDPFLTFAKQLSFSESKLRSP